MITITKWLNFAIQQRVEYLFLRLSSVLLPKFPITILTCKTLVVLKLFSFRVEEGFSDSSVLLPSLKTLHLEYICEWNSFCLTNLTRADIDCTPCYFPLKTVHNTHSLRLKIHQGPSSNELIPTFHDLTQLELISFSYSWQLLVELLNHFPKLQKLHIDQAEVDQEIWSRIDDREEWVDLDVVPECLSLHLTTCNLFNFLGLQVPVNFSVVLELFSFSVKEGFSDSSVLLPSLKTLHNLCLSAQVDRK
ncbi:uncharacterized protein LOC131632715 [Vicia villosa]|uniref:uncharacterized protein LOC131632715 n=1 Tax=Vicia villosa TaxID=3911 RepID=UPI00273BDD59|nr:uncharacterized protein LOC131632715 [Vicia villosa]